MFFSKKNIPPPKFAPQQPQPPPQGIDKLTGEAQPEPEMEDPEIVAARQEQEKRRKEKHRKMEAEREKIRQQIRDKYHLKKNEEKRDREQIAGRIAGNRKTPEQVALESIGDEDDEGIMAQLGLTDSYERAKNAVSNAVTAVRGYFTFMGR